MLLLALLVSGSEPPLRTLHIERCPSKLGDAERQRMGAPYPSEGCSREIARGNNETGGTKFMVMMAQGRVGSTWLMSLLKAHGAVLEALGEDLAREKLELTKDEEWQRFAKYYDREIPNGAAIGAKQKAEVLVRHNAAEGLIGLNVKIIALARSNPVELVFAQINGDAHQRSCGNSHTKVVNESCYTDIDAQRTFQRFLWSDDRIAPHATCAIRSSVVHTLNFFEYVSYLATLPNANIFWLEYHDLFCDTSNVLTRLLHFLDLDDDSHLASKLVKLTSNLDILLPNFTDVARQLARDPFVHPSAFKDALRSADSCRVPQSRSSSRAGFCPLHHRPSSSSQEERRR